MSVRHLFRTKIYVIQTKYLPSLLLYNSFRSYQKFVNMYRLFWVVQLLVVKIKKTWIWKAREKILKRSFPYYSKFSIIISVRITGLKQYIKKRVDYLRNVIIRIKLQIILLFSLNESRTSSAIYWSSTTPSLFWLSLSLSFYNSTSLSLFRYIFFLILNDDLCIDI